MTSVSTAARDFRRTTAGRPCPRASSALDDDACPSIVVVDDAVEVRTLVRTRLRLSGVFDVVGEGSTGQEAVELAGASCGRR